MQVNIGVFFSCFQPLSQLDCTVSGSRIQRSLQLVESLELKQEGCQFIQVDLPGLFSPLRRLNDRVRSQEPAIEPRADANASGLVRLWQKPLSKLASADSSKGDSFSQVPPHSGLPRTETSIFNPHVSTTRPCGRIFLDPQGQIPHDQSPKKEVLITPHLGWV